MNHGKLSDTVDFWPRPAASGRAAGGRRRGAGGGPAHGPDPSRPGPAAGPGPRRPGVGAGSPDTARTKPNGSRSATTPRVAGGLVGQDADGPVFIGDAIADPLSGLVAAAVARFPLCRGGGELIDIAMSQVACDLRHAAAERGHHRRTGAARHRRTGSAWRADTDAGAACWPKEARPHVDNTRAVARRHAGGRPSAQPSPRSAV